MGFTILVRVKLLETISGSPPPWPRSRWAVWPIYIALWSI